MAAAIAALLTGCNDGAKELEPPVEQVARELARAGADSVIVFVSDGDREYVATAGSRHPGVGQRFRIGSVTKTFTATIVLQLVAEGRLDLGSSLDAHLPGVVPEGKRITIRQLLEHRSGLANVTDYQDWLMRASRSSSTSPIDTLRFAATKPPVFPPGSRFGYSNTNYIALGLVIEKVTGRTYRQELEERILDPLELEQAELPSTRRLEDLDDEGENPNLPWAAGAIVADASDIARFFSALLGGDVLTDDSLVEMKETAPDDLGPDGGGLGIFRESLSCGRFWGHDGGILDYGTLVRASEDGSRVLVLSVRGAVSGEPPDTTRLLCPAAATNDD